MTVSKRSIDAELSQIPSLKGLDGNFDRAKFLQVLSERHLTEDQARGDIARDLLTRQLSVPVAFGAKMPKGVANAYAALFLEVREAQAGAIPAAAMTKVAKPTDAQLNAYYTTHQSLYQQKERRVIEYVVFDKAKFVEAGKPTDAEIAALYAQQKDKYTPHEVRTLTQLVIPDEAKARAAYAKAKAGTPLSEAAKGDGFEALTLASLDRAAYTNNTSADVAQIVFSSAQGALAPLTKSALGWYIVHIDKVTHDPGKSLEAARPELIKALQPTVTERTERAFADFQNKLQDKASAGASVTDLAKLGNGTVVTTPAIDALGTAPEQSGFHATPDIAPLLHDAFKPDSKPTNEPLIVAYGTTRAQFALYHVKAITPAGPLPFAQVKDRVAADALLEAQSEAARQIADEVVDKVNHGTSLAAALKATGLNLPPIVPIKANKLQVQMRAQQMQQAPSPAVMAIFGLKTHQAKMIEAPGHQGWSVVWLAAKTPIDPSTQPQITAQVQQQLGSSYGEELAASFAGAAQQSLGAKRFPANIKALTESMARGGAR